ncbi:uncharacterized protein L3040_001364 [Drepanopeziza brunnea f. sp. 'multigermtubi']|uniref:uncharacterized protein n=1 Tax=Drepanopeziza brunnea f. sp. 'multigermtubi' TaxID=698441 RepID=UPI00238FEDC5|nr:hypothetical protein L3040_001364 [Drepanopeziza brunnea f. sp. 'multigermtubi']
MSHERSTPSSPGSEEFAAIEIRNTITPFESWAMRRSDDSLKALAGAAGGFTSGMVTCPLDVIKTKLQAQGGFRAQAAEEASAVRYSGLIGTGKTIWSEEGLRGMYRGLGPIILGYLPTWAVYFVVYGRSKEIFGRYIENASGINFCSSLVAGGCSTLATNPIWVIKTRLMSQVSRKSTTNGPKPNWHYRSTWDAARKMYATEGLLSFYSGLTPALLGLAHVAVQFPAYEYLKREFTGQGMGESAEGDDRSHFTGTFFAGVLSKMLASSATYPHEVIRTRLQTQQRTMPSTTSEYVAFRGGLEGSGTHTPAAPHTIKAGRRYDGIVRTFKTILKEEGWRAFYAGMGTNMMRAVPAATTTLVTYEWVMKHLNQARAEGIQKSSA